MTLLEVWGKRGNEEQDDSTAAVCFYLLRCQKNFRISPEGSIKTNALFTTFNSLYLATSLTEEAAISSEASLIKDVSKPQMCFPSLLMTLGAKDGSIPLLHLALRFPAELCCVRGPCSPGAPQDSSAGMGHGGGKGILGEPNPCTVGQQCCRGALRAEISALCSAAFPKDHSRDLLMRALVLPPAPVQSLSVYLGSRPSPMGTARFKSPCPKFPLIPLSGAEERDTSSTPLLPFPESDLNTQV